MSIDAVIDAVKRHPAKTELWLRPRIDTLTGQAYSAGNGQATIAGRRLLTITVNPDYAPQTGDEIWGNAHQVVISKDGTDHLFGRIMRLWDGTEEVLCEPEPMASGLSRRTIARCEDCKWRGKRRELIWVKARPKCYWRCPECHSQQVKIERLEHGQ